MVALELLGFAACGDRDLQWVGSANEEHGTTTTGSPDPVEPSPESTEGGDSTTGLPSLFLGHPDLGEGHDCDLWSQDCPAGMKCMPWANDGGGSWNATRCSAIDPDPDTVGEPCMVDGSGVSGIDSCELGAMCWDVDPQTNAGTCVALCTGSAAAPVCEDPSHLCIGRHPQLCLPSCCPVEQDCPEGQACYPLGDTFVCSPDASGDLGAYLDPCEFVNVCDPGYFCANPEVLPPCVGWGCCAPYCNIGSTTCAEYDPNLACVPWFGEGEAPPVYQHIGACMLME